MGDHPDCNQVLRGSAPTGDQVRSGNQGPIPSSPKARISRTNRIPGQSAIGAIPPFEGVEDREKEDGRQAGIEVRTQRAVPGPGLQVPSGTPARTDPELPALWRGGSGRGHGPRRGRSAPRPDDQGRHPRVRRPEPAVGSVHRRGWPWPRSADSWKRSAPLSTTSTSRSALESMWL